MSGKLLFLDTCAVVKIFIPEQGHDVMMWLLSSEAILAYSIHLMTSTHVKVEFPNTIAKMVESGQIEAKSQKGILMRSRGYLDNDISRIHCVDVYKTPSFITGKNSSAEALIAKHNRKEKDRTDMSQLSTVINYLRCFSGGSLPHVVTSDRKFKSVIRKEKYGVIDPEKMTIDELKKYLSDLDL